MNSNRQAFISRFGHTVVLSELLRQKIAEKSIGYVAPNLRRTIESIAFKIEEARTLRLNYATVQELTEENDFLIPGLKARWFSESPRREWLRQDAAFVYDFCQSARLQVTLAPFYKTAGRKLASAIAIEWKNITLTPMPTSRAIATIPLLQIIRDNVIEYPPAQEAEIRSRASLVMKHGPKIFEELLAAIDQEREAVKIFLEPMPSSRKAEKDLLDDVRTLCELLGLEARVVKASDNTPEHVLVRGLSA